MIDPRTRIPASLFAVREEARDLVDTLIALACLALAAAYVWWRYL